MLDFLLFSTENKHIEQARLAGLNNIVVDLEKKGKSDRQRGYFLELSNNNYTDIKQVKKWYPSCNLICRINSIHDKSNDEINRVLDAGANTIMLPIFYERSEVEEFIDIVDGRANTILLFETKKSIESPELYSDLPFDSYYIGLNDLKIDYGYKFAYEILAFDILEKFVDCFPSKPFGFGGITLIGCGHPLTTEVILNELVRLGATLVILRRAFKRDIIKSKTDLSVEINKIRNSYEQILSSGTETISTTHNNFLLRLSEIIKDL